MRADDNSIDGLLRISAIFIMFFCVLYHIYESLSWIYEHHIHVIQIFAYFSAIYVFSIVLTIIFAIITSFFEFVTRNDNLTNVTVNFLISLLKYLQLFILCIVTLFVVHCLCDCATAFFLQTIYE